MACKKKDVRLRRCSREELCESPELVLTVVNIYFVVLLNTLNKISEAPRSCQMHFPLDKIQPLSVLLPPKRTMESKGGKMYRQLGLFCFHADK